MIKFFKQLYVLVKSKLGIKLTVNEVLLLPAKWRRAGNDVGCYSCFNWENINRIGVSSLYATIFENRCIIAKNYDGAGAVVIPEKPDTYGRSINNTYICGEFNPLGKATKPGKFMSLDEVTQLITR